MHCSWTEPGHKRRTVLSYLCKDFKRAKGPIFSFWVGKPDLIITHQCLSVYACCWLHCHYKSVTDTNLKGIIIKVHILVSLWMSLYEQRTLCVVMGEHLKLICLLLVFFMNFLMSGSSRNILWAEWHISVCSLYWIPKGLQKSWFYVVFCFEDTHRMCSA